MADNEKTILKKYVNAVGADRYRITAIRMQDGEKLAMVVGPKEGVEAEKLTGYLPVMRGLEVRGENLYLTPLSDNKYHILIDDVGADGLEQLAEKGYRPAAIVESSPKNYQAIVTIPRQGDDDKAAVNDACRRLNCSYGDPNLSGSTHPHRAPGFKNFKPSRRLADGSYPTVGLVEARGGECEKTTKLVQYLQGEMVEKQKREEEQKKRYEITVENLPTGEKAYWMHYNHLVLFLEGQLRPGAIVPREQFDKSRIDSMIATRMAVTGHCQEEIERTIRLCVPEIRGAGAQQHDWDDYARRTAAYPFDSAQGRLQVEQLRDRYYRAWVEAERREGCVFGVSSYAGSGARKEGKQQEGERWESKNT